jgi:hypothetical protein
MRLNQGNDKKTTATKARLRGIHIAVEAINREVTSIFVLIFF